MALHKRLDVPSRKTPKPKVGFFLTKVSYTNSCTGRWPIGCAKTKRINGVQGRDHLTPQYYRPNQVLSTEKTVASRQEEMKV